MIELDLARRWLQTEGSGGGASGCGVSCSGGSIAKGQNHNVIAIRHAQTRPPLIAVVATLCIIAGVLRLADVAAAAEVDSGGAEYQLERHPHRGLFADTKYWLGNMEFGNRDNWRNKLKPCTMLERIAIGEDANDGGAVISFGDNSIGSLESARIRQLVLANDGVLLLQSDTLDHESAYMKYLADHPAHCFDSTSLPELVQDQFWFSFGPSPDHLSWFNPANWKSDLVDGIDGLVPESHLVPCSHDVVVFGRDPVDLLMALSEFGLSSPVTPFKVNFRPSEAMLASQPAELKQVDLGLRVAKLKIGNKTYTQDEFNQLIEIYGDLLFNFNDPQSIFNLSRGNTSSDADAKQTLIIDESSLSAELSDGERCLEVAGCLCANEAPQMMKIICSFHEPLGADHLLCHDPIKSSGYCNPICATLITINMSPFEFNEQLVISTIGKLMEQGPGGGAGQLDPAYFGDSVFSASRRIDQGKYEITFRIYPLHNEEYENILGRERELAQLVKLHLDRPAIKSFYGIKSVNVKSSVHWRSNSQTSIFWLVLITSTAILMLELGLYEGRIVEIALHLTRIARIVDWLELIAGSQFMTGLDSRMVARDTMTGPRSRSANCLGDDLDQELDETDQECGMIELDSRSVTDSTMNLLID